MKRLQILFLLFNTLFISDLFAQSSFKEFVGPTNTIINDVDISPSKDYVVAGFNNGLTILWSVLDNREVYEYDEGQLSIRAVEFSPIHPIFITGSDDSNIKIWDYHQNICLSTLDDHDQAVTAVSFSEDGRFFISGSIDGQILLWKLSKKGKASLEGRFQSPNNSKSITDVGFSPDGQYIIAGFQDGTIATWRKKSKNKPVKFFSDHNDYVNTVAFSPQQTYILSGGDDGTILLRFASESSNSGPEKFKYHNDNIYSAAITNDEKWIVSCGAGGLLIVGDIKTKRIIKQFNHPKNAYNITSLSLSKDDEFILTGASDGIARLWILRDLSDVCEINEIAWKEPLKDITVYKTNYLLKASIKSKSRVTKQILYLNGNTLPQKRGLNVHPNDNCTQYFEQKIRLKEGENIIGLEMINLDKESIVSETMIINYERYLPVDSSINYLLLIGVDQYRHWDRLHNAVRDAKSVKKELFNYYRFNKSHTYELYDGSVTYTAIYDKINQIKDSIRRHDNLIIYYSGHGYYEEDFTAGYLVPNNAKIGTTEGYIPYNTLLNWISGITNKHTYLILDACYAGKLFEEANRPSRGSNNDRDVYIEGLESIPSRRAVTSGFNTVSDGKEGGNSPFATVLLKYLEDNRGKFFTSRQLELHLALNVPNQSDGNHQKVKGDDLRITNFDTGKEEGEFIWRPKK